MRSGLIAGAAALVFAATPAIASVQHAPLEGGVEGIYLTGELYAPDEAAFRELADRYPEAIVFLDSPGGAVVPSLEIGKLVGTRGYATVVLEQSECASACALIWLAGTPRYLDGAGWCSLPARRPTT